MNPQKLLISIAILALLGLGYWYTEKNPPKGDDAEKGVLSLEEDSVQRLRIERPGHVTIELRRNDEGKWVFADHDFPADQSAIGLLTTNLTDLNSERMVAEDITNWTPYGFEAPALTVEIEAGKGDEAKTYRVQFGNQAPSGAGVYGRLEGEPKLYLLFDYVKTSFEKELFDLREKKLLDVDGGSVSALAVDVSGREMGFAKDSGRWSITAPVAARADQFNVSDLARSVQNAEMVSVVAEAGQGAAIDFQKPFATAKVTDSGGEHVLTLVKRAEGDYAARSSDLGDAVFEVSSTFVEGLDKELAILRNRNVFEFGFQDIGKLRVVNGGAVVTLERRDDKWLLTSEGDRELVAQNVQGFIDALRGLSAAAFPSDSESEWARYGLASPAEEVEIVTADGAMTEVGVFSNWAATPVNAARKGEPAVYQLEPATATALRQAFEKLTDAPGPAEDAGESDAPAAGVE